jgi:hypothetical protein
MYRRCMTLVEAPQAFETTACSGTGRVTYEKCDGGGVCPECDRNCRECDGEGDTNCEECTGTENVKCACLDRFTLEEKEAVRQAQSTPSLWSKTA